ncbi:boLa class II histocompatibility antigen, DQB*0101 beta chain [Dicentrarchus labrax]|uniref:boLa class II histocompatibility antigen, DQB*0101 beta chain n=1 Tax=Dicentrarchus labrax TaxID=13489 RepID=UPI0021F597AA|nr:boLa class II histocompatibility antigen, DQB*0101 beta chain [Dicentrarchus labrax]
MRGEKERYCLNNVNIDYPNALDKSVKPYVRLSSVAPPAGKHPSMLVCSVYDFFPKHIRVSWLRDGQEVTSDVTSTDELADADWFYQIHSHLEYTPRSVQNQNQVHSHLEYTPRSVQNQNQVQIHSHLEYTPRSVQNQNQNQVHSNLEYTPRSVQNQNQNQVHSNLEYTPRSVQDQNQNQVHSNLEYTPRSVQNQNQVQIGPVHSHLEYTPRSGEKISCVVEHASLREPLVTDWDPSMPESERNKIAIGASGLILGLILSLAGFIYYKRKARGQTSTQTETRPDPD